MKNQVNNLVEIKKLKRLSSTCCSIVSSEYDFALYKEYNNINEITNLVGINDISNVEWFDGSKLDEKYLTYSERNNNYVINSKVKYVAGGNPIYKKPFFMLINDENGVKVYVVKQNEQKIEAVKKKNALKLNKKYVLDFVLDALEKGILEYSRDYKYTDDYAYDYANNYGECDWCLIENESFMRRKLIRDIESGVYSFIGDKNSKEIGIYSSWESYNVRKKVID